MDPASPFPTGAVTWLFTDIEGYSLLEDRHRGALQPLLNDHNRILRDTAARWNGRILRIVGDSFFIAFARPSEAVQCAVEAQRTLAHQQWQVGDAPVEVQVRMGMHTGEARFLVHEDGQPDYFGTAVNVAARIMGAGSGGQILASEATRALAGPELPKEVLFDNLGTHRLKGVGEAHIWQVCPPADKFPPLKTLSPERHNLPLSLTPFVGRDSEIAQWTQWLRESNQRMLTLTGFGGMGKSRTALQIAEMCFDDFADGVWWVPLENARTGDEMTQRIAEQLRLRLQPQPTVREQLWDFHRERQLLLVLDNVEQIRHDVNGDEAAEVISGLLNAGPRIKCLVTSRRSLNLAAQQLIELNPMPATDAEQLFVERARARKDSFVLNQQNAADVAAICSTLEGVPLAIEIAASLVNLMAPRQIVRELDDLLELLESDDPLVPRRHHALRAAIDWSYNLLSEDAKLLFPQLSVFSGGFTFAAARAVCEVPRLRHALGDLRSHSLLRGQTDVATQQERLRMLESVRQYAAAKLTDPKLGRRHAEYFLEFAEGQVAQLRTSQEMEALAALQAESDNLRAAMAWAEANSDELCARLALAFQEPLYYHPETTGQGGRGSWSEALQCLQCGLAAAARLPASESLRATLLHRSACLAEDMGNTAQAITEAEQSLKLYRALGDAAGTANALSLLGVLDTESDDSETAMARLKQALELYLALGDEAGQAKVLHNVAGLASKQGDFETARRTYEQSLVHRRLAGDLRGEAKTLGNLGGLAQQRGDHEEAARLYQESLKLRRRLREPLGTAIMLNNLAELAMEHDAPRAMILLIHAERMLRDLQSALAREPAEGLERLAMQLGRERYERLHREAQTRAWEDVIDGDDVGSGI